MDSESNRRGTGGWRRPPVRSFPPRGPVMGRRLLRNVSGKEPARPSVRSFPPPARRWAAGLAERLRGGTGAAPGSLISAARPGDGPQALAERLREVAGAVEAAGQRHPGAAPTAGAPRRLAAQLVSVPQFDPFRRAARQWARDLAERLRSETGVSSDPIISAARLGDGPKALRNVSGAEPACPPVRSFPLRGSVMGRRLCGTSPERNRRATGWATCRMPCGTSPERNRRATGWATCRMPCGTSPERNRRVPRFAHFRCTASRHRLGDVPYALRNVSEK